MAVHHAKHDITIVEHSAVYDQSLSIDSLGALLYLLTLADEGADIDLIPTLKQRFKIGRTRAANIQRELICAGYLSVTKPRDYRVSGTPQNEAVSCQ